MKGKKGIHERRMSKKGPSWCFAQIDIAARYSVHPNRLASRRAQHLRLEHAAIHLHGRYLRQHGKPHNKAP